MTDIASTIPLALALGITGIVVFAAIPDTTQQRIAEIIKAIFD